MRTGVELFFIDTPRSGGGCCWGAPSAVFEFASYEAGV